MMSDDLAALYARAFPGQSGWGAADFREVLASPGAFLRALPHAFALGRTAADEAELLLIATDPSHQRTGLGARCLGAFHDEARIRGAQSAFLEVAESNIGARALYDAAGYVEVGRRNAYYSTDEGLPQTALILRRTLL
ncbi:MAG: GNAT family N-acetyltransferase [Pseudomonadota bacterium]